MDTEKAAELVEDVVVEVESHGGAATTALPPDPAKLVGDAVGEEADLAPLPTVPSTAAAAGADMVPFSWTGTGVMAMPDNALGLARGLPPVQTLIVVYRISSGGYAKLKPHYITKRSCLLNAISTITACVHKYPSIHLRFILIKDCCTAELSEFASMAVGVLLRKAKPDLVLDEYETSFGSGAASFSFGLDAVRALADARVVNPVTTAVFNWEDDYLHTRNALSVGLGGLALAPYVSLYDHNDKYVVGSSNPLVTAGGEVTRVYRGIDRHWKGTNSTTMTFVASLAVLLEDEATIRIFTSVVTAPPDDFHMWLALGTTRGRLLISPLPGVATHGEKNYLAPYCSWDTIGQQALEYLAILEDKAPADATDSKPHKKRKGKGKSKTT